MKISTFFILAMLVFIPGCVEHFIFINVKPDAGYKIEFISKGDSTDVFDDDFPHPTAGDKWAKHIWSDRTKDDTTWIMETRGYIQSGVSFNILNDGIGSLIHPVNVNIKNRWISTLYTAQYIFKGREIYRKYPRLGESIETSVSIDSVEWVTEALVYILSSALKDISRDRSSTITPFMVERITTHVRNYAERVRSKKIVIELSEEKIEFLKKLMRPFRDDLSYEFYNILNKAMHQYEEEWRITTGLQDDIFHFHLTMPGLVTRSNADTIAGDTLKWTFELGDFAGDDHTMEAVSVIYNTKHIQRISLFLMMFGLSFWLFLWFTVFRKT